ncbi:hypothetical protein FRC01_006415 [Tulasnella sp. 417]|nr:hypothetical protein FRC01_006415 [Tulasnella sp. 417]
MNRHPYGGYDAPPPRRRSASPPPYRGGGGYRGRGGARPPRGRGGAYGGGPGYDPGYDAYGSAPQDPYSSGPPGYGSGPMNGAPDYAGSYGAAPPPRDPYYGGPPAPSGPSNDYSDYPPYNGSDYGGGRGGYEPSGRGGYESGGGRGGHEGGGGRGRGGGAPRGRGRIHDDRVHSSIIEERLMRERPCRTLFIRNIKYETPSETMRVAFEAHGEIKTFFDLIKNRGMVFVTFYDLRAAERAREKLQGMDVSGRPIDVHYSLPREHELTQRPDREKNQGTLLVTMRDSLSRQAIDENELRRKMQQFGEVKSIKPVYDGGIMRHDQRLVEYYDSRACVHAHDRLRDQTLQDGLMDLEFEWDVPEEPLPPAPPGPLAVDNGPRSPVRYNADRGPAPYRGAPGGDRDWEGPPRGRGGGPPYRGEFDRAERDYPPPDRRGPDYRDRRESGDFPPLTPIGGNGGPPYREYDRGREERDREFDRGERGGRGGGRGGFRGAGRDEWRGGGRGGRGGGPGGGRAPLPPRAPGTDEFGRALLPGREEPPSDAYGPGPGSSYPAYPGGPRSGPPGAGPPGQSAEERLEQAKKVQELLAALKPGSAGPPPGAVQPPAPSYGYPPAPGSGLPPMPSSGGYAPSASTSGYPPYSASSAYQPSSSYQPPPPSSGGGDMQNLLALLAQNQQGGAQPR